MADSTDNSFINGRNVTWIERLRRREPQVWQQFWDMYVARLHALARKRLLALGFSSHGAEDIVVGAFGSLWKRLDNGRVRQDETAESLWSLLATIVKCKVAHRCRDEHAQKRDRSRLQREGDVADPAKGPLHESASREQSPPDAVIFNEALIEALQAVARDDTDHQLWQLWIGESDEAAMAEVLGLSVDFIRLRLATLHERLNHLPPPPADDEDDRRGA